MLLCVGDDVRAGGGFISCRNRETKRDDFVFYTNRLACLVIEYALSFLPFQVLSAILLNHLEIIRVYCV